MDSNTLYGRIAAWETAGLIDASTAERLRIDVDADVAGRGGESQRRAGGIGPAFGPSVAAGEVLAYLGAAFLLVASYVFAGSLSLGKPGWALTLAIGGAALVALALGLRSRSPRMRRGAGAALFFAALHAGFAVACVADTYNAGDYAIVGMVASVALLGAGIVGRRLVPGLATQAAVLVGLAAVTFYGAGNVDGRVFVLHQDAAGTLYMSVGQALVRIAAGLIVWFAGALVISWVAGREAREATADGDRRAGLARFVAGLVAVIGATQVFSQSVVRGGSEASAALPAWLGHLGIAVVALVLIGIALRRGWTAYVYPAALGLVIALTAFNAEYIASQTGAAGALLVEGAVLIAAGVAADRVRRRVGGQQASGGTGGSVTPSASAA